MVNWLFNFILEHGFWSEDQKKILNGLKEWMLLYTSETFIKMLTCLYLQMSGLGSGVKVTTDVGSVCNVFITLLAILIDRLF